MLRRTLYLTLPLLLVGCERIAPHEAFQQARESRPPAESVEQWEARFTAFTAAVAKADAEWRATVEYAAKVDAAARAYPSGQCGGDLPTCAIMRCESGGNIRAENPHSTASGKWQVLDSTLRAYKPRVPSIRPYSHASHAPERAQDDLARAIWDGGRGRRQWVC